MSDFMKTSRADLLDDIKRMVIIARTLDLRTSDNLDEDLLGTFKVSPERHIVVFRNHRSLFYRDVNICVLKRHQLEYLRDSLWSHLAKYSIRAVLTSDISRV